MASKHAGRLRLVLLILLGLALVFILYRYTLHRMVESKLEEIRKEGYPVTLAELDKWYPQPPPGENAADMYLQAFQHNVKSDGDTNLPIVGFAHTPSRGVPLPSEMEQGIAEFLNTNQEALTLLHKATTIKTYRYPKDFSDPNKMIGSEMKQFTATRQGERLLCLESLSASAKGDSKKTAKSIADSLVLAETLRDRSLLISYLVEKACLGMTIFSLDQAMSRLAFTEPQLVELSAAFRDVETTNSFTQALVGERAWGNEEWDEIRKGKVPLTDLTRYSDEKIGIFDRLVTIIYRPSGLVDLDHIADLDLLDGLIKSSTIAFPQRFERINLLTSKAGRFRVLPLARIRAKLLRNSAKRDARFIAQLRCAITSVEIERFRNTNGTLPDSLDNLLPAFLNSVPIDPFDGQPLRYKKLAKGYVVYSVGEDGKDDGGAEPRQGYTPGTDITFTVER